jgi:WD40 repeat protein
VNAVSWSSDGKTIATASGDKTVRLWDSTTGKSTRTFDGHTAGVAVVAFSPDGKSVASGGSDKKVLVWDAGSGKILHTLGGFQDAVTAIAWAPGSGGMLAAGSYDKNVRIFNMRTGQPGKVFEEFGEVYSLAWSASGQTLVSGHADHRAHMWQVSSGKQLHTLESAGDPPQVSALAFSPSDAMIASGRGNHTMQIWNAKTAALVVSVPTMAPVQRVSWTPDSRTVVSSNAERTARFFDPANGQLRGVLLAEPEQIVAVSADGHYRADAGGTELVVVAQLDKGQETLSSAAFATKFKWKNTAAQVKLTGK